MDIFRYGSVLKLTREDTAEDIDRNLRMMSENGMNTVVVWPAACRWEENGPDYPFHTGKVLLKIAEKYGIDVIMELAGQLSVMEYIPDSEMKPEYYALTENGDREFGQSSFGYLNYFHPEVKELICRHFRDAALAYRDAPALLGYDIFNETMFRSFDEYTMEAFRVWLREKYGTIGELNRIWERTYSDWSQVGYEKWKWMSIMPEVDYARFRKAAIGIFMKSWRAAIEEVDRNHLIIADNIGTMVSTNSLYSRPQDDFDLKNVVDVIGMSFYPKQQSGCKPPFKRWEAFDAFFAASRREGFYISEMQTHIQAMFNPTTAVEPYELKQWCLEAYAGGANALIFWMWRPFTKGLQTLGRGLVDYCGRSTPRLDMARELSGIYSKYGVIKPVRSHIAVVFDSLCDDFQRQYTSSYSYCDQTMYLSSLMGAYSAFYDCNVRPDIALIEEIDRYKAVILSNHIVLGDKTADKLRKYVNDGGTLIIDGRFGLVDEKSNLLSKLPGGEIAGILGVEYTDTDGKCLKYSYAGIADNSFFSREILKTKHNNVIAAYPDDVPAVIREEYGAGQIILFNTHLWYGYYKGASDAPRNIAGALSCELGLKQVRTEDNVKIRLCENKDKYLAFVFNYNSTSIDVRATVNFGENEKIIDCRVNGYDVLVVEYEK